jgi:hypothetical protein
MRSTVLGIWLALSGTSQAASIVPGPNDPGHDAALAAKMEAFRVQLHELTSVPLGFGLETYVSDPANRQLIDDFFASGQKDFIAFSGKHPYEILDRYGEHGDLGMFGGVQAAGDAFRYAVLRDSGAPDAEVEQARRALIGAMRGLHWVHQITGVPGVISRGIRRIEPEAGDPPLPGVPESLDPIVPLYDENGNVLPLPKEGGIWHADNSGELPFLIWKSDTSKDQLCGYIFAIAVIYDVVARDPTIPADMIARLQEDARQIGKSLMQRREIAPGVFADLVIVDVDGRPVEFHDVSAEEPLPGVVSDEPASGFNAAMALGMIRALYHITGDPELWSFYNELTGRRGYFATMEEALASIVYIGTITNFSNVNMMFVSLYGVLRYENDPVKADRVRGILDTAAYDPGVDRQARGLRQSLFDFIFAGFNREGTAGAKGAEAASDGLATLVGHRAPPYWSADVQNCDDLEIEAGVCTAIDGSTIVLAEGRGRSNASMNEAIVAEDALPIEIRPPSNFTWRSDPHAVNGGGGTRLNPGGEIYAAYWMGRYLQAGARGTDNISPIARGAPEVEDDGGCGCRASRGGSASLWGLVPLIALLRRAIAPR